MKNFSINWRTTLAGAIAIVVQVLPALFPKTITPTVANSISVIAGALGLAAAKDGNVTGIGVTATTIENDALPVVKAVDQLTIGSSNVTMQDVHTVMDKMLTLIPAATVPVAPISYDEAIKADQQNNQVHLEPVVE